MRTRLWPEVITKGRGKMPAFGAKIKPDDITKLVAYIRDLPKKNNKPCSFDCLYGEAFRPPASAVLWFLGWAEGTKSPNSRTESGLNQLRHSADRVYTQQPSLRISPM